ncbi:MAG TPA: hypothetical protein VLH60_04790, partial [Sedimentisphaerales bacterium]|nr:hypothetical protein [Sedimentisphaerales bacterium]
MDKHENRNNVFKALYAGAAILLVCAGAVLLMGRSKMRVTLPHVMLDAPQSAAAGTVRRSGPFRVLHVMSYHLPWEWTET